MKHFISVITFGIIVFFLTSQVGQLLRPDNRGADMWPDYYAEENDTIDVVFIGSSSIYRYWIPTQAYDEQGFTSALLASGGQNIRLAPYIMKEAVRSQDADLIVVEVRSLLTRGADAGESLDVANFETAVVAAGMKPSINRLKMIQDVYDESQFEKVMLMFPILKYHDNIFEFDAEMFADRIRNEGSEFKFARQTYKVKVVSDPVYADNGKTYLTDEELGYIDDIQEMADELGKTVLFVSTPYSPNEKQSSAQLEIDEYISAKGYNFIDLNNYVDEIGLDFGTDYYNRTHTNIAGARKVTSYLAQYIEDNYEISTELTESQRSDWEAECDGWHTEEEALLGKWQEAVDEANGD